MSGLSVCSLSIHIYMVYVYVTDSEKTDHSARKKIYLVAIN